MEAEIKEKPREFTVGEDKKVVIKDCATIRLDPNEQVTFITENGREYDVCYKGWGFYATPSINGRLSKFGFKTALVRNMQGMYYIWLVEKEEEFYKYLNEERHQLVRWLNDSDNEERCLCGMSNLELIFNYTEPPVGEMPYDLKEKKYDRSLMRCNYCGHLLLKHDYNLEIIYQGQYTQSTYANKLVQTFNKIINLPETQSDNGGRVSAIVRFCKQYFGDNLLSVLDVGSGLCVFLYMLSKKLKGSFLALDPDPMQAQHAQKNCGVASVCCDFFSFETEEKFDLIAFNKVLEHVQDPIKMLSASKRYLTDRGVVYIELPDGTAALKDSLFREEFFIEHYHAFSISSLNLLIEKAGFYSLEIERLREPSGKYTLRAFCAIAAI